MYAKSELDYIVKVLGVDGFIQPENLAREAPQVARQQESGLEPVSAEESVSAQASAASQPSKVPTESHQVRRSTEAFSEPHPPVFEASGDPEAPLVVFFTQKPVGAEASLLKKMLAAMKVKSVYMVLSKQQEGIESPEVQVQWGLVRQGFKAPLGLIFGSEDFHAVMGPDQDFSSYIGCIQEQGGVRWLVTHGVNDMTQAGSAERQVQVKKETWTHLQSLMREMP